MKKYISLLLALVLVLSLCACAPSSNLGSADSGFRVGYGREKIMPEKSVPLRGYGNTQKRLSKGFLDYLYLTCIAITDENNNTVLMYSIDNCNAELTSGVRSAVTEATGIPEDHIFMTATHTHSGPDTSQTSFAALTEYKMLVHEQAIKAAQTALEDRKGAEIYYGTAETEGLNFVRHYKMADGTYMGDNFGDYNGEILDYATKVDPTIHIIKFTRGEGNKDIILMNWRAHATMTGGSDKRDISADYVSSLRDYMEAETGCLFGYYQGAAGNVNPRSRIKADTPTSDYKLYGKQLGSFAMRALENMEKLEPGAVKTKQLIFSAKVNHTMDSLVPQALQVKAMWDTGNYSSQQCVEAFPGSGVRSAYHANAIISNAGKSTTFEIELDVLTIGEQLAFTMTPNEQFDTNGVFIEENSPYDHTIVLSYSNGSEGYIPSAFGYEYTCYESDTTVFAPGTGEEVADAHIAALQELKGA